MLIFEYISYLVMLCLLGYYIITTLQWYSYKPNRVIFHHTKMWWNYIYFLVPFVTYDFVMGITSNRYGHWVVLFYIPLFYHWYKKVDKPLVFTKRVKLFFASLLFWGLFLSIVFKIFTIFIPIVLAHFVSVAIVKIEFGSYKKRAKKKLESMPDMKIIGVTASYGKTSIKNFIATLLSQKYSVYPTPRSVNTLGGVVLDINTKLPKDTDIYVVEMGAREEGDIAEITTFVEPHYAVVGKIGPAHIEYFKTLENIRNTKLEILQSKRLQKAWIHSSANINPKDNNKIVIYGDNITDVEATLDGIRFKLDGIEYQAPILGSFNAQNLAVAILVAKEFGLSEDEIKTALAKIEPIEHRLQRIDAGGKVILDDSFNGNIDGMRASFELSKQWSGRKIVITPGLVEAKESLNEEIAKMAEEIFDIVAVTGTLNIEIFRRFVSPEKLVILDKADMEEFLTTNTKSGDLILFANDAPSFV